MAIPIVVIVAIVTMVYVRARYKIADANQAIVITGGKGDPLIRVGGGAFVPPFRKAEFFDLGLMTVTSTNEATQTTTMVNVIVEWTAQLRADTSKDENGNLNESLRNAILGFTNYEGKIADSLQQTLEGEVRAVIATLTPEDLVRDKAGFAEKVNTGVRDSMADLGFKLVSLNIGKITDPNEYYDHLSAKDREEKRTTAANLKADADQSIAIRAAEADNASKAAEQKRDLAVVEQAREVTLREAAVRAETDLAQADANIAGQLQTELRNQELATREGAVAVIKEQQRQAAATARRDVEVTEAETAQRKLEIEADASAEVTRRTAQADADAATIRAQGEADAINRTTEARAHQTRETGLAAAEVARAQGEAEAAAKQALGEAEANAQLLMAQALAAEGGANLTVALAEVEAHARITISTNVGQVMAEVGKNARFVDMGGANGDNGDLVSRVLGNLPDLLAKIDVRSEGLLDSTIGGALGATLAAIRNGGKVSDVPAATSVAVESPTPVSTVTSPSPTSEMPVSASVAVVQPIVEPASPVEPTATAPSTFVEAQESAAPVVAEVDSSLDRATLEQALAEATESGVSATDIAERFGVDISALEGLLGRRFTPGELLDAGLKAGKSRSRKKS
ncbi:MAG: SPFH domain-containing protein [Candidatus Saccharimonadales bacterium]